MSEAELISMLDRVGDGLSKAVGEKYGLDVTVGYADYGEVMLINISRPASESGPYRSECFFMNFPDEYSDEWVAEFMKNLEVPIRYMVCGKKRQFNFMDWHKSLSN